MSTNSTQVDPRNKNVLRLKEDTARLTNSLDPTAEATSGSLSRVLAQLEAELSHVQAVQDAGAAAREAVEDDGETVAGLVDALTKAQTAHKSLISGTARLDAQLRHLAERAERDRTGLETVHQRMTQDLSRDSLDHALSLTNEALIAELGETRRSRDASHDELAELLMRLRSTRALIEAAAAMDAGADREAAVRAALGQVEEEMQEEMRHSSALIRDLEVQLEAAKSRLHRAMQLREALDAS